MRNNFFCVITQASRGENRSYTGEIRAYGTEISSIRQVTRDGRAIKAEDGGSDAGEEAQPGTQGNHITSHIFVSSVPIIIFFFFLFLCTLTFSEIRSMSRELIFLDMHRCCEVLLLHFS